MITYKVYHQGQTSHAAAVKEDIRAWAKGAVQPGTTVAVQVDVDKMTRHFYLVECLIDGKILIYQINGALYAMIKRCNNIFKYAHHELTITERGEIVYDNPR